MRKIIHIDMDAFFASVAQLDDPTLRGKPIAVGSPDNRGVISAASYEARKFGVRSAMSSINASKLCPELIFVKHNFTRYKEISNQIRAIFYQYTDLVEPLSLDEAYLDVTHNKKGDLLATEIAKEIRTKILKKTGLTASAGISYNKFLAKIASDINKPDGQKLIHPTEAQSFLDTLPINRFYGIGVKTAEMMKKIGIFTGRDLREWSVEDLEKHFKNSAQYYYNVVRGIHESPVKASQLRKSISTEITFKEDLIHIHTIENELIKVIMDLNKRLKNQQKKGRTLHLKLKLKDFTTINRSITYDEPFNEYALLYERSLKLFRTHFPKEYIRLIGLGMSNFDIKTSITFTTNQLEFDF